MITPQELISEARTWIGVPFRHQGRSRHGIDCAGFLEVLISSTAGLPAGYAAPKNYKRRPNGELLETVERYCIRTTQDASRISGCVVLMQWPKDVGPSHIALCTGATLIHAHARARKVLESGYRGPLVRDTHSVWLVPGVRYV